MATLVEDFYRQNEWANLRLIEICRGLTDEQLDAVAPGGYGSIRATLLHLIDGETTYVRRLGGSPATVVPSLGDGWPGFAVLTDVVRATATALTERALTLGGTTVIGERFAIEANVLLVQAINHSTDHRSQICSMLSILGALPSTGDDGQALLDAWSWSDANGLARPLA